MKKPYSKMSIERLERSVSNHSTSFIQKKADYDEHCLNGDDDKERKRLYQRMMREKSRLKQAKLFLQKRTDERDMKNH